MKVFAILTASLMTIGGGYYFFQAESGCSGSRCGMPLPATSGCCSETASCCAAQEECCPLQEASSSVATSLVASVSTKSSCCAKTDECCIVTAACCTVEKVNAVAKPVQIEGCCEACVSPTSTIRSAAKSIVSVK